MKIIIRKIDNGWAFDTEEGAEIKAAIIDHSKNELVIEIVKPYHLADLVEAPAPAPETDEEVPGEAEAWARFRPDTTWAFQQISYPSIARDFRAALRVAIEADRKQRGVDGVITREQFEDAYRMFALYPTNLREPMLNAIATLGITVED